MRAVPLSPSLLGPADVRSLVRELGLRPTKALGQNFVVDANTVRRIVVAAGFDWPSGTRAEDDAAGSDRAGPGHDQPRVTPSVLEIGPGLGSLTLGLLAVARVVAVEVDPVLAAALPGTAAVRAPGAELRVLTADALRITPAELPGPPPTVLVANLPYNVAVPVLLTVLERFPSVVRGLVMVQQEVADRLVAPPGSRIYGVPSVKAAWWAALRPAGPVPRTVFWPAPHVDSGLVAFTRREPPGADRGTAFALIDAAFGTRRKTLRAALAGWAGSAPAAEALLRAAGIDPGLRGEALGVPEFARLAAAAEGRRGD